MTYYRRLFTPKAEKSLLTQAHDNKFIHLSLMGNKSWDCNQKLLTVMYSRYEMSLLNSILEREGNQDMEINTTPVASIKFM